MGVLDGKVAIVTGGGGGVGRGISLAFAKEGAKVVVLDVNADAAQRVAAELVEAGGESLALTCDIRTSEAVNSAVAEVVDTFGTVDIMVNNAQGARGGVPFEEQTDEDLALAMDTGPLATAYFMRACFPHLKGGGRVINVRSGSEAIALAGMSAYVGAKGAIGAMTKVVAREWGQHGITVNCLAPAVMTEAARGYFEQNPDKLEEVLASQSIKRFGDAEADAGRAAVFLAGPDASYVTGCTLAADGGGGFFG